MGGDYGRDVDRPIDSEARNAASERYRTGLAQLNALDLNDDQAVDAMVAATMTEGFVREDRRRLIGLPHADRDQFGAQVRAWTEMGEGTPVFALTEVREVAGSRLTLVAISIGYGSLEGVEMLQVILYDDAIERLQRLVSFDLDDVEGAFVELGRLHAEIVGEGEQSRDAVGAQRPSCGAP
jgi:hypothetical protein